MSADQDRLASRIAASGKRASGLLREVALTERYRHRETRILYEVWCLRAWPCTTPSPDWLAGMKYAGRIITLADGSELVAVNLGDYLLRDIESGAILTETSVGLVQRYVRVPEDDTPPVEQEYRTDPRHLTVEGMILGASLDLQELGSMLEAHPERLAGYTEELTTAPSSLPAASKEGHVPAIRITVLVRLPRDGGAS